MRRGIRRAHAPEHAKRSHTHGRRDEHTYAVRIDDGAMLDGHEQIQQARVHLSDQTTEPLAGILGCEPANLEKELDTLAARAQRTRR